MRFLVYSVLRQVASPGPAERHLPHEILILPRPIFHETRDTGFLLARLEQLWRRVPRYKPLSVGVVMLDLVAAGQHQPDLFSADNHRRQKLSPLVDRINDRYGRCSIGFGLFPTDVRAFKGHAAFHRVPEKWEF